jgi:Tol biopolymer transport system component
VDTRGRLLVPPFIRGGMSVSNEDDPTWSPDGRKIAFVRPDDPDPGIYVVNANGGGLKRLSTGWDPTWSPNGRRIAFTDDSDIYVMNADGTRKRKLFHKEFAARSRLISRAASALVSAALA